MSFISKDRIAQERVFGIQQCKRLTVYLSQWVNGQKEDIFYRIVAVAFLLNRTPLGEPVVMFLYIRQGCLHRQILPSLMMKSVTGRMPVQDLTGRPVIRRDDDPLVAGCFAPQTDVVCVADEDIVLFYEKQK